MGRKTKKKSNNIFCFPEQTIIFLKFLPRTRKMQFWNPSGTFMEKRYKILAQNPVLMKKFFPTNLICGHINCSFENFRERFNESPKTFRPKSQNDKHMCGYFRKKIPAKKYSAYVESTFNNFALLFRTKISKLSAQTFQQNFSLDSLMQF